MATQLTRRQIGSSNALLLARIETLEILNIKLRYEAEAASRDSEELRQTNEVKDEVLGLVAHELRSPLTTILGNASILLSKRDLLEPSTVDLALGDIQADAKRLQRLIANLLSLARPKQEAVMMDEPLDLGHLVQAAMAEHRRAFPTRLIQLTVEDARIFAAAHPDYTEEVVANLLTNAEKYSPPEEQIEIRLRRSEDQAVVSVLDRGPGISEVEEQAVFRPFYRSPATSNQVSGLGLGLAVCKRLIEIQGGRIWVAPRQGGGSEFTFALPFEEAVY